jgi:hypothetical protein
LAAIVVDLERRDDASSPLLVRQRSEWQLF